MEVGRGYAPHGPHHSDCLRHMTRDCAIFHFLAASIAIASCEGDSRNIVLGRHSATLDRSFEITNTVNTCTFEALLKYTLYASPDFVVSRELLGGIWTTKIAIQYTEDRTKHYPELVVCPSFKTIDLELGRGRAVVWMNDAATLRCTTGILGPVL
ncbi:hypothetical protein AC579_10561 [Pseudocercospora musae]|uniref:Uncharacterized protein n=1 Tax=Pseudocercospora musae TaxID=113226 RepID=A0A139I092_9PEZI|nr:hypothetical protein AC579_10561 [Pseudocercospora musae]